MSFGKTLRSAREAKGLTVSQVASQTRILVQIISDMENEDFHRIPAPIYGRGFVRLFAECVGLNPAPLIQEFMEIYEGRRSPFADITPPPAPEPPPPAAAPAGIPDPIPEPPPADEQPHLQEPIPEAPPVMVSAAFAPRPKPEPVCPLPDPIPAPNPEPAVPRAAEAPVGTDLSGLDLFSQADSAIGGGTPPEVPVFSQVPPKQVPPRQTSAYLRDGNESPFLPPTYETGGPSAVERFRRSITSVSGDIIDRVTNIPRSTWRICLLGVAALAILALIVFACISLYQATARMPTPDPVAQVSAPSAPAMPARPVAGVKPTPVTHAATTAVKPGTATRPTLAPKPGRLRSTGQKVPSLYVD